MHKMDISMIGEIFIAADSVDLRMSCVAADLCLPHCDAGRLMYITRPIDRPSTEIYPLGPVARRVADPMEKCLKQLKEATPRDRGPIGLRLVPPAPVRPPVGLAPAPVAAFEIMEASSHDEHTDVTGVGETDEEDVLEAGPPRVAAGPLAPRAARGSRGVELMGRRFSELYSGGNLIGHSLDCERCGYSRSLNWVASGAMTQRQALGRLLAWEQHCPGSAKEHKGLGGPLLRDCS